MKHKFTISNKLKFLTTALLIIGVFTSLQTVFANESKYAEGTSSISGKVVDAQTGEPIIGATVQVDSTNLGAFTDLDGNFRIKKVPFGYYSLTVSSVGFDKAHVATIVVTADQNTVANIIMHSTVYEANDITVKEKALINTEAMLLKQRQNANEITDAISSEEISRSGSSTAADAMSKVTGATILRDNTVNIRGMSDRYAQAKLNGSVLPSPDPDKQAVPMDMIPTALLDNIIVEKSFTPDKPGDFAGGSVNLTTKDYPEERSLKFSTSSTYNSQSTFDDMLSHTGSDTEWLGYDDGQRDLPQFVTSNKDYEQAAVGIKSVRYRSWLGDDIDSVTALANYIDNASKSFNPEMEPIKKEAPINQSYSASYGDLWSLFDKPLGVVSTFSYSRKFSSYTDGFSGKYKLASANSTGLTADSELNDSKGSENTLWSGLLTLKYGIHTNHKLGFSYARTQNGESTSRYLKGEFPEHVSDGELLETRKLSYKERNINVFQFDGDHLVIGQNRLHWQISKSDTKQEEPDYRYFTNQLTPELTEDPISGDLVETGDTLMQIYTNRFQAPSRGWRNLTEEKIDYRADLTIPFSRMNKAKVGYLYQDTDREYTEALYRYTAEGGLNSVDNYAQNVGLTRVDTAIWNFDTTITYVFDNILQNETNDNNQYSGYKKISAFYGMLEYALTSRLNLIGGLRVEKTDMFSKTQSNKSGQIKETDYLPSLSLVFKTNTNMNIRGSYGRTLARPSFKEFTLSTSEEFGIGRTYTGNNLLKRTVIDNYDLRWEWFLRPGEILAISGFYKALENPIEQTIFDVNGGIQAQNSDNAEVYGVEVEFRRSLDHITPVLSNFSLGGNFAIIHSIVKINEDELKYDVDTLNPQTERPLEGQSPYVINLDFGYNNRETGTTVSLFYNVFGERLAFNAANGAPDVYELPFNQLDMIASQVVLGSAKIKLSVKNILGEESKLIHEDVGLPLQQQGTEYVYSQYSIGTSVSLGVSYDIW